MLKAAPLAFLGDISATNVSGAAPMMLEAAAHETHAAAKPTSVELPAMAMTASEENRRRRDDVSSTKRSDEFRGRD